MDQAFVELNQKTESLLQSVEALRKKDLELFGRLLSDSHRSLRDDYEVTGYELDALVDAAARAPGCAGARMTGAGFGGCAIALVRDSMAGDFERTVSDAYQKATGLRVDFYRSVLEDGVHEITAAAMDHCS